jgi:predicted Zn-dependent protease
VPQLVLNGRAAMMQGKPALAAAAYRKAAEIQERKLRDASDPPIWWYPVRRSLAAALLADGKADEAATQARKVLTTWPNDPVTLAVLAQAERKLGDGKASDLHMAQASRGWHGRAALAAAAVLPAA